MVVSTFQGVVIAIVLFAAVVAGLSFLIPRRRVASESRMRHMMRKAGLDPDIDPVGEHDEVIQAIRRSCRRCGATDECEAWLEGEHAGDNSFCPNARVFEILAKYRK